jgi:hypothetical protein
MVFKLLYVYDYIKNDAGNKQNSYNITKMQMFAILDKVKANIENIRCLNLAAFKNMIIQVTRLCCYMSYLR